MALGQSYFMSSPEHEKVYLSHGHSLRVLPKEQGIQLKSKRVGTTLLTVGSRVFEVHVIKKKLKETYEQLQKLQTHRLGWQAEIENKELVIKGKIHRFDDWKELTNIIANQKYKLTAKVDQDVQRILVHFLKKQSQKKGLQFPRLDFTPSPIAYLPFKLRDEKSTYEAWLGHYGIPIRWSKNLLIDKPLVHIKVHFIESNKVLQKQLGLHWKSMAEFHVFPSYKHSKSLSALLKWMRKTGSGRVLATPSLTTESHEESSLLIGGEIPITMASSESNRVVWKNYGLSLKFLPKVDSTKKTLLDIEVKLSSLDLSLSSGQTPALKIHRFKSSLQMEDKTTVLLSQVSQLLRGQTRQALPIFHSIPILGEILKSKDYINQSSEVYVFVSLHLKESANESNERIRSLKKRSLSVE